MIIISGKLPCPPHRLPSGLFPADGEPGAVVDPPDADGAADGGAADGGAADGGAADGGAA